MSRIVETGSCSDRPANLTAPVTRRGALRIAAGIGLSFALPGMTPRASAQRGTDRPTSLIMLWMGGGPSQMDTWDPHPGSIHSGPCRAIDTSVPGLQVSHLLPQMAEQMHRLTVIRSLVSKEGDHQRGTYFVQTGYRPDVTLVHPSLGAIVAKEVASDELELPRHIALATNGFALPRGGFLGNELDAFNIPNPGLNIRNMRAGVGDKRQSRRLANLDVVSQAFRRGRGPRADATLHQHVTEEALRMMTSGQLKAFEFDSEPAATIDAYGDSRFGRGCLIARRLVETGVRSVQVTLNGFDTHADNYNGHITQCSQLDPAFASLMKDLADRDLLESTIVLCIGEFGRTPWINPLEGRDHWPNGFACVVGGGGLRAGHLIGATDPDMQSQDKTLEPENPVKIPDLYATILQRLDIAYDEELLTAIGRPIARTDQGTPIPELLPNT